MNKITTNIKDRPRRNINTCGKCDTTISLDLGDFYFLNRRSLLDSHLPLTLVKMKRHLICLDCFNSDGGKLNENQWNIIYRGKYNYKRGTRLDYEWAKSQSNGFEIDDEDMIENETNDTYVGTTETESSEIDDIIMHSNEEDYSQSSSFIGRKIAKKFSGVVFKGEVKEFDPLSKLFKVVYVDEDQEEFTIDELRESIKLYEECGNDMIKLCPTLRNNTNKKSLWNRSVSYMDQLGHCREDTTVFSWYTNQLSEIDLNNVLQFDSELGRVYFSKFMLQGKSK